MTRKPLPYLCIIMAAYAAVTSISPDMFGAPPIIRGAIIIFILGVIVASAILLIKEFME